MKKTLLGLLISFVLLLSTGFCVAQERRLSSELNAKLGEAAAARHGNPEMIDVIIQFRKEKQLQQYVSRMLALGAVHESSLNVIHGGAFRIPVTLLPVLARDPEVVYVSPDRRVTRSSWDFMLDASQATPVLKLGYSGNGIGVAVIDSGIRANLPDLQNPFNGASRVVYSESFLSGTQSVSIQSFPGWQANTAYAAGSMVMYNGVSYQCLQAHTSQTGWEPPNAPALWRGIGTGTGNYWQANLYYAVGSWSVYDGNIYQCVQAHTSQAGWEPPNAPALWQSEGGATGTSSADDFYGHGTHVAGIIAGNGASSGGWMSGLAPKSNLIDLRVLDANGSGTDSAVISAIDRAIQLKNTFNIRVINLSLGRKVSESYTVDPVCQAVEAAWKAGIVVVVAAGNYGRDNSANTDGYATITVPGNDPYVITVGATNTHYTDPTSDDTVTSYSSKGPTLLDHVIKPDLVAPGNRIVSLLASGTTLDRTYHSAEVPPSAYGSNASTASYFVLSGTSMAAPVVSGTVALMLEHAPCLTPDQVKIRLMKSASKSYPANTSGTSSGGTNYSLQDDIFEVGAGYVNAYGAVTSNEFPTGTSLSPLAVRDSSGTVHLQADGSSAWATTSVWSSSIVWGTSVLQSNSIVWGSSIVWGASADSGYSIVWGTSITWGASTPFSESGDSDKN